MQRRIRLASMCILCSLAAASPALAVGPVDAELGAVWWDNRFDATGSGIDVDSDGGAPGYRAELWFFHKFGLRAAMYSSEPNELDMEASDYLSVDLMWRAFSPSSNNFFALGAGWQEMDLDTIGLDGGTSGARLALEGRIGLPGPFYLDGVLSYLPSLDDAEATDPALGRFEDLEARELDLGFSWTIVPFVALRAGYREQRIDFRRTGFLVLPGQEQAIDGEVRSAGWLAGLTFRF